MWFTLGFILGIVISTLVLLGLVFLRLPIEQGTRKIERRVAKSAPSKKGFVIQPESEAEQARNAILEKNRKEGKDTLLSELYDENT